MPYYFPDDMHGAIMIKKIAGSWCEYVLDSVQVWTAGYGSGRKLKKAVFKWEKHHRKCWGYQPFDDGDYYTSPYPLVSHIKRWAQHKIRLM